MIGLNTSMTPLGMILSSPFVPGLARRYGSWFLTVACFCITAVMLFLLAVFRDLIFWFPLRFILGIAINVIFIISESWINQLAIPKIRGRIVGIYATVAAAGFALGPMILIVSSTHGWMPFILGISVILAALPILIQAKEHLPEFDSEESSSVLSFLSFAPLLLFSVASAALFEQVTLSLLPIYGLRHGLSESASSLVLGTLIVGNVFIQIPIGWLADLISRRVLLIILSFTAVSGSMLLPILIGGSMLLWPMLLIWGAVAYGTYTVALVELGDRFSGAALVAGCGAFSMMWGIGGTLRFTNSRYCDGYYGSGRTYSYSGPDFFSIRHSCLFHAVESFKITAPKTIPVTSSVQYFTHLQGIQLSFLWVRNSLTTNY